jgi:O-antigen ligase
MPPASGRFSGRFWGRWERWLWPALPVGLVFAAHLLRGANTTAASLTLACAEGLLLAVFLSSARLRAGLARTRGLLPLGILFALALGLALGSTLPTASGPVAELRRFLGEPGAAAVDISATVIEIAKLLGLASLCLVGVMLGAQGDLHRPSRRLVLGFGAAFGLFAIALFGTGLQPAMSNLLSGEFLSHNTAGTLFGLLTVLAASGIRFRRLASFSTFAVRRIGEAAVAMAPSLALTLGFAACLILTGSRGAWIATLCGLFAFILLRAATARGGWIWALASGAVIAAGFVGLVDSSGASVTQRLNALEPDAQGRLELLRAQWAWVEKAPWRGWGLGAFDHLNTLGLTAADFKGSWDLRAAHNAAAQWLEETGALGAGVMALALGFIMVPTAAGYLRRRAPGAGWIAGLLAADVVVLVHSLDDYALQVPSMAGMWALLLGVQFALGLGRSEASSAAAARARTKSML